MDLNTFANGGLRPAGQSKTPSFPGLDWTEPKPVRGRGTFLRIFSGRGILFRVGPGWGIFYQGMGHFLLGFRG